MADPLPETSAQEPPRVALPPITLCLLREVKAAQDQHGLKHGDYARYRHHCASRLRSLHSALKFLHGRTKYQKRKLDVHNVTDVRHLHILLFNAERAWSFAMDIKAGLEKGGEPHSRHHLHTRLAKASYWAGELARLASELCDTRGLMEAEAYSSWMKGTMLLEKGKDWEMALAKFLRAKRLWSSIAKVGDLESQAMCLTAVEDMEPSVRYCTHQLGRRGAAVPSESQLAVLADGADSGAVVKMEVLQAKVAALVGAPAAPVAAVWSVEWGGATHPVRNERVKACLQQVAEYSERLSGGGGSSAMEEDSGPASSTRLQQRLAVYDKIAGAYAEARNHLRVAMKALSGPDAEAGAAELSRLEAALTGRGVEAALRRWGEVVGDTEERFGAWLTRVAAGKRAKEKDRYAQADDVIRSIEVWARHAQELEDLGAAIGGRGGEEVHNAAAAARASAAAALCYYGAHVHLAASRPLPAYALFQRVPQLVKAAAAAAAAVSAIAAVPVLPGLAASGDALAAAAAAYAGVAHAEHLAGVLRSQEEVASGVRDLAISGGVEGATTSAAAATAAAASAGPKYLLEAVDVWESFVHPKRARVARVPPAIQPIPVRPIMLDTASEYIAYPSLSHRVKKSEKKSTFARLFGWKS